MGNRKLLALAAIVAVVAVGGIGFAAFTSSAYINATGTAGQFQLYWSGAGTATGSAPTYNVCSDYITSNPNASDTLVVSASALAPGDSCTYSDLQLNVYGNLPGSVSPEVTTAYGSGCGVMSFHDNFGYEQYGVPLAPLPISPSSPITYSATLTLFSGLGNTYQGAGCTFVVTFSGTAS